MIAALRAVTAGLWLATAMLPTPAQAGRAATRCESIDVQVTAANAADRASACAGARDAIGFFAALGLHPKEPITVSVVARLPKPVPPTAAGCYLHAERRVFVLGYAALRRHGRWFDVPIDRAMHRSVVSHEVAHALTAACGAPWTEISWHGREYVAYVTMLATMAPALRERVLRAQPGTGFDAVVQITPLYLAFDPAHFAAEAYRHYLKPGNGDAFVRGILEGRALTE